MNFNAQNPNPNMPLVRYVGGTWRVGGLLALSRAFGDAYLKGTGQFEGVPAGSDGYRCVVFYVWDASFLDWINFHLHCESFIQDDSFHTYLYYCISAADEFLIFISLLLALDDVFWKIVFGYIQ